MQNVYGESIQEMADGIYVINVGNYIGSNTRSEIEYAKEHGKTVEYLEPNIEENQWNREAR